MPDAPSIRSEDLFGTDGVRGIAGVEITASLARDVARAFAQLLGEEATKPNLLLARDTRVSGPELADAFADELCRCGVRVTGCGVLPTGGLCLLVSRRGANAGAIISASHNPPDSNGIKLVDGAGHKLPAQQQQVLEELIHGRPDTCATEAASRGDFAHDLEARTEYLQIVTEGLPQGCLSGLRVVLDCAHGSASQFAQEAFERAGAAVAPLNCDADGTLINVECGSTVPQTVAKAVVAVGADLGVAFDGDADRCVLADHEGDVVDGDGMKYILATDLQQQGLLDPPLVIGTVMNNFGLEQALKARGIELERTPVGDRHVVERMRETGAWLGGEQSGHIIFRDRMIGDGIITALQVCGVMAQRERTLAELAAPVEKIPQHLVNLHAEDTEAWRNNVDVLGEIERWERRLEGPGRILIRASGTEPLVRVMVEAEDPTLAQEAVDALAATIRAACNGGAKGAGRATGGWRGGGGRMSDGWLEGRRGRTSDG